MILLSPICQRSSIIRHAVFILFVRYGKAFETEPTLHSGINNVVLLMAAGHEFETSIELRKIGAFFFLHQRESMANTCFDHLEIIRL